MHVFVTGGSGLTGPAIVSELISHGHTVTALARSEASAAKLKALGGTPFAGSLQDLDRLTEGAAGADGVIHMGFGGDFADPDALIANDVAAIQALGRPLGPGQPFVTTSGTFAMAAGSVSRESDPPDPQSAASFRIPGERACLARAEQGVRATVVRLSPTVHGPGDFGFIPAFIAAARRSGTALYIGDGSQRWPAIHREDAASLFRLALERGEAGRAFHGAGEEAITIRSLAETIGALLDLPVSGMSLEEAQTHFENPFFARVFSIDAPASSALTQAWLGWEPTHPTLLHDLEFGDYLTAEVK